MINIAICDDDLYAIEDAEKNLEIYAKSKPKFTYKTQTFQTSKDLICEYKNGTIFDIAFIDIYINLENGIQTARELRDLNYMGQIIFVTSSKSYALDAYSVDALQYLVKPINAKDFCKTMDKALALTKETPNNIIALRSNREVYKIELNSIMYTETNAHYQDIHLTNGTVLSVRSTFTALFEEFNKDFFVQIGKTYIINFHHVKKIDPTTITMSDNAELFLPRNSYQKIKYKYFEFLN
ncbi:MAG: LytTR family DNA-binding domain-containing protein [Clostridia bacterium]